MSQAHPPGDQIADLIVTEHQWWWEIEYAGTEIVSANEIHIPIGKRLRVRLSSADVIHSFSVARVARKMDAIPDREILSCWRLMSPACIEKDVPNSVALNMLRMGMKCEEWLSKAKVVPHQLSTSPSSGASGTAGSSGARLRSLRCKERRWIPKRLAASLIFPPQSDSTR